MKHVAEIHAKAHRIIESDMSWKEKYDMIFSDDISLRVADLFEWYDPDMDYKDDVWAFMHAFDEYIKSPKYKFLLDEGKRNFSNESLEDKRKLYLSLLRMNPDDMSDADVDLMYTLSKDKQIQNLLEANK